MMKINSSNPVDTGSGIKRELTNAAGKDAKEDAKLKAACTEMEAVFLNLLLTQMRRTVPKNSLSGESSQQEMMRSMLDSEMTKDMAKAGGTGLADMLYRQLTLTSHTPNASNISNTSNTSKKSQAPS